MNRITVGVVGNPNCGKTTLFNALTGARQRVGNWPGVTVERKTGVCQWPGAEVTLVDLPGVYSLGVVSTSSVDEQIARDYALSGEADLIVNIVDASNLERNLYLTTQLLEMRAPVVVVLNMMDVARERRIDIDTRTLAKRLGCPVVPVVASRERGPGGAQGARSSGSPAITEPAGSRPRLRDGTRGRHRRAGSAGGADGGGRGTSSRAGWPSSFWKRTRWRSALCKDVDPGTRSPGSGARWRRRPTRTWTFSSPTAATGSPTP